MPLSQGLHPIAREAWASIHQIYGAQCYETPLVRAEWLRERADAAQVSAQVGLLQRSWYTSALRTLAPCVTVAMHLLQVHLKAECKQSSGSYRARGAAHKLMALSDEELQVGWGGPPSGPPGWMIKLCDCFATTGCTPRCRVQGKLSGPALPAPPSRQLACSAAWLRPVA